MENEYIYKVSDIAKLIIKKTTDEKYHDYSIENLRIVIQEIFDHEKFTRKRIGSPYYYTEDFKNYCLDNIDLTNLKRKKKDTAFERLYYRDIVVFDDTKFIPQRVYMYCINNISNNKFTPTKIKNILRKHKDELKPISVICELDKVYRKFTYKRKQSALLYYNADYTRKIINILITELKLDSKTINQKLDNLLNLYV